MLSFVVILLNALDDTHDEVRDPRQALSSSTWFADMGIRCNLTQCPRKDLGRAFSSGPWQICSDRSGQNQHLGLFNLANTNILVCSISIFRTVWSGQYTNCGLIVLANTHISVCLAWPVPKFKA